MKNILITGGTGYLGSNFLRSIEGYEIHLISRKKLQNTNNCNFYQPADFGLLKKNLEGKKIIFIHMATCYGRNNETLKEICDVNINLPLLILETFQENIQYLINIDTTLDPRNSIYSATKNSFKKLMIFFKKIVKINIKFDFMCGPDNYKSFTNHLLTSFFNKNKSIDLSDCDQLRNFIYIDDLVYGIKLIISQLEYIDKDINFDIGADENHKLKDYIERIKFKLNSSTKLKYGALKRQSFDVDNPIMQLDNIKKIGWKPDINFDNIFDKLISHNKL